MKQPNLFESVHRLPSDKNLSAWPQLQWANHERQVDGWRQRDTEQCFHCLKTGRLKSSPIWRRNGLDINAWYSLIIVWYCQWHFPHWVSSLVQKCPLEPKVLHHVVGWKLLKPSLPPRFGTIRDTWPFWISETNQKVSQLDELESTQICCT